jgi:hypothetical protein
VLHINPGALAAAVNPVIQPRRDLLREQNHRRILSCSSVSESLAASGCVAMQRHHHRLPVEYFQLERFAALARQAHEGDIQFTLASIVVSDAILAST